jgi:hypothetical protein
MVPTPHESTEPLKAWSAKNKDFLNELIPLWFMRPSPVVRRHMALERERYSRERLQGRRDSEDATATDPEPEVLRVENLPGA